MGMSPQSLSFICLCCCCLVSATSATKVSADDLVMKALNLTNGGYISAARPPPDNGTANKISVFIYLTSLVDVDSTSQEIVVQLWVDLLWQDNRLSWLGQFGSSLDKVSLIMAPSSTVWLPDVGFYNIKKQKRISNGNLIVKITNTGEVQYTYQTLVTSKCKMKLLAFPYDSQTCACSFSSTIQGIDTLRLQLQSSTNTSTVTTYLSKSSEFCINRAHLKLATLPGIGDNVDIVVSFTRIPIFYVINLILPSILLLAISTLTFKLPPECEERVAFSVTIVLSMCVFLQLIGNYTPTQSESVPMLTWYYSLAVVMTMLCVVGNVFVLNCHFKRHERTVVDNRVIRILFLNRFITGNWRKRSKVESVDTKVGSGVSMRNGQTSPPDADDITTSPHSPHDPVNGVNEWIVACRAADNCFFAVTFGITVIIAFVLIVIEAVSTHIDCLHGSGLV